MHTYDTKINTTKYALLMSAYATRLTQEVIGLRAIFYTIELNNKQ